MNEPTSLLREFRQIIWKHDPTDALTHDLASLLRRHGHPEIPKDPRTIKQKKRTGPGSDDFVHLGLVNGIKLRLDHGLLDSSDRTLFLQVFHFKMSTYIFSCYSYYFLQFNVDGIPLWKSSRENYTKIRTVWVCDAPARSFLKATIGHNGRFSCERCTVVGHRWF